MRRRWVRWAGLRCVRIARSILSHRLGVTPPLVQGNSETVIASEAKQSIVPRKERMDCFAALAMTSKHTFTASRRDAPEALRESLAQRGRGNAGCPLQPRPRVHLVLVERTRVTTSTPESPDVPARNGFNGFLRALVFAKETRHPCQKTARRANHRTGGESKFHSCPGRGAAPFALLRRAGTHSRSSGTMDPGSAAHHAASHSASKTRMNALMALRSIRGTSGERR